MVINLRNRVGGSRLAMKAASWKTDVALLGFQIVSVGLFRNTIADWRARDIRLRSIDFLLV